MIFHTRDSFFVEPLFLQELQTLKVDAEWWLLDSGASVLSDRNAAHYGVDLSSVQVAGETEDRQYGLLGASRTYVSALATRKALDLGHVCVASFLRPFLPHFVHFSF